MFTCVTDISDIIHPLIEVMIDHVQVRLYWLIMFWQDFIENFMLRIELHRALYTIYKARYDSSFFHERF